MDIRPLHDCVVLKRDERQRHSPGGILIPDTAGEKPTEGRPSSTSRRPNGRVSGGPDYGCERSEIPWRCGRRVHASVEHDERAPDAARRNRRGRLAMVTVCAAPQAIPSARTSPVAALRAPRAVCGRLAAARLPVGDNPARSCAR
jgi:hypothetical protein